MSATDYEKWLANCPVCGKPANDSLWSNEDLSAYLAVPIATVRSWRSRGEGPPGRKVGRHVRYRRAEVEAWLDKQ